MNRIDNTFEKLKAHGKKALITFVTAGDPDIYATEEFILAMEKSGADIIEIGVPFSDPVAEGPIISRASERALKNGVHLDMIFEMVRRLRKKCELPLLLMMYANSVYKFGSNLFFTRCKEVGIDGVIIPDLPFEERGEFEAFSGDVHIINLVAPTSGSRIEKIASHSKGFLYCVSSLGVTGVRSSFHTDFRHFFEQIQKYATCPTAVGFGISTAQQVEGLIKYADGIIVGSAIVKIIEDYGKEATEELSKFVYALKKATE